VRRVAAAFVAGLGLAAGGCDSGDDDEGSGASREVTTTRVEVVEGLGQKGDFDPGRIYARLSPGVVTVLSIFEDGGSLLEDGVNVQMDAYGLLNNIADAAKVAPMQPWALSLYRLRQSTFLQRDPMFLGCKPPGGPRQFQQLYGFQFVEQPDFKREFVLLGGGNRNRRTIYTDGRKHVGQLGGNDDNPLFYGHGIAHWEGDTFVVDNRRFNEEFWFDNGGLPHTELLQMTERFTRVDMGTLRYEVTINDPGAYTRPFTIAWDVPFDVNGELPEYICQENNQYLNRLTDDLGQPIFGPRPQPGTRPARGR